MHMVCNDFRLCKYAGMWAVLLWVVIMPYVYTRAFPDTDAARMIGIACHRAAIDPKRGDYSSLGLVLLRELQERGYGVFKIDDD